MSKPRRETELKLKALKAESEMPLYSRGAMAQSSYSSPIWLYAVLVHTGERGTFPAVPVSHPHLLHYSDTRVKKE